MIKQLFVVVMSNAMPESMAEQQRCRQKCLSLNYEEWPVIDTED